jgi:hypothetical protein
LWWWWGGLSYVKILGDEEEDVANGAERCGYLLFLVPEERVRVGQLGKVHAQAPLARCTYKHKK